MEKLLFEIGTEEIPAKFMPGILKQLQELAAGKMQELRIPFENITVYGTPRRMTFIAEGVAETQADSTIEAKGPSVKIAFVSGAPSKAAIGFARGQGVDVNELEVRGEYVYAVNIWQVSPLPICCRLCCLIFWSRCLSRKICAGQIMIFVSSVRSAGWSHCLATR